MSSFVDENHVSNTTLWVSDSLSKSVRANVSTGFETVDLDSSLEISGISSTPINLGVAFATPVNDAEISTNLSNISFPGHLSAGENEESSPPLSEHGETGEDRTRRELAESEALAWEMMQQENLEAYRMQMEYIRQNSQEMSEDDIAVMQMLMNESIAVPTNGIQANEEGGEEGENEGNQLTNASDPEDWEYDRLLALGQLIGDVKTERWRQRATTVIAGLEKITFQDLTKKLIGQAQAVGKVSTSIDARQGELSTSFSAKQCHGTTTAHQHQDGSVSTPVQPRATMYQPHAMNDACVVCMEGFVMTDELHVLPCKHYFHDACTNTWLQDHNSCPLCKTKVVATP